MRQRIANAVPSERAQATEKKVQGPLCRGPTGRHSVLSDGASREKQGYTLSAHLGLRADASGVETRVKVAHSPTLGPGALRCRTSRSPSPVRTAWPEPGLMDRESLRNVIRR